MGGLFLFEFSQGVRWEFGVVFALRSRFKGSGRNLKRIFVFA